MPTTRAMARQASTSIDDNPLKKKPVRRPARVAKPPAPVPAPTVSSAAQNGSIAKHQRSQRAGSKSRVTIPATSQIDQITTERVVSGAVELRVGTRSAHNAHAAADDDAVSTTSSRRSRSNSSKVAIGTTRDKRAASHVSSASHSSQQSDSRSAPAGTLASSSDSAADAVSTSPKACGPRLTQCTGTGTASRTQPPKSTILDTASPKDSKHPTRQRHRHGVTRHGRSAAPKVSRSRQVTVEIPSSDTLGFDRVDNCDDDNNNETLSEDELCGPKTPLRRGRALQRATDYLADDMAQTLRIEAPTVHTAAGAAYLTSPTQPNRAVVRPSLHRPSGVQSNVQYVFHPLPSTRMRTVSPSQCSATPSRARDHSAGEPHASGMVNEPKPRQMMARVQSSPGRLRSPVVDKTSGAARNRLLQLLGTSGDATDSDESDDDIGQQGGSDNEEFDVFGDQLEAEQSSDSETDTSFVEPELIHPIQREADILPSSPARLPSPGLEYSMQDNSELVTPDFPRKASQAPFKTPCMRTTLEQFADASPTRADVACDTAESLPSASKCINPRLLAEEQHEPLRSQAGFGTYRSSPLKGGSSLIEGTPLQIPEPLTSQVEQPSSSGTRNVRLSVLLDTDKLAEDFDMQVSPRKADYGYSNALISSRPDLETVRRQSCFQDHEPHYASPTVASDRRCKSPHGIDSEAAKRSCQRFARSLSRSSERRPRTDSCASLGSGAGLSPRRTSQRASTPEAPLPDSRVVIPSSHGADNLELRRRAAADQVSAKADSPYKTPKRAAQRSPVKGCGTPGASIFTPHPGQPLRKVVALVEIFTLDGVDASRSFIASLRRLGAQTMKTWHDSVTHVIFKEGSAETLQKVQQANNEIKQRGKGKPIVIVNSRWVTDCDRQNRRIPESASEYAVNQTQIHSGRSLTLRPVSGNALSSRPRESMALSDWGSSPVKTSASTSCNADSDLSLSDFSTPVPPATFGDKMQTQPVEKIRKLVINNDTSRGGRRLTTLDLRRE